MADLQQVKTQLDDLLQLSNTISTQFDSVVAKIDELQQQIQDGAAVTPEDLQDLHDRAQAVKDTLAQVDEKQDLELASDQPDVEPPPIDEEPPVE